MAYRKKGRQGFVLFHSLSDDFCDLPDDAVAWIIRAAFDYSLHGALPDMQGIGPYTKSVCRNVFRGIDAGIEHHEETRLKNAFKGYLSACRRSNETPLDYSEWLSKQVDRGQPQLTDVDRSQPQLTAVNHIEYESELESEVELYFESKNKPEIEGCGGKERHPSRTLTKNEALEMLAHQMELERRSKQ